MKQKKHAGRTLEKSLSVTLSGLALVGLLSGCGGGGGESVSLEPVPAPVAPAAMSGVVADGYLRGATVCLDVNLNKLCDADEPTATTGAGGQYSIAGADLALLPTGTTAADYPILVEVPADAIDEDGMVAVGKAYVMAGPAGKPEFVSPMTTLVQNQLEANPVLTPIQAETLVKAQIGIGADSSLFEDYVTPVVANKTPEQIQARAAELAKVHKVAQVVARTMAEMKTAVETAAQGAGVDLSVNRAAIVKLVTEEVMTKLQTINSAVEQTAGTFDPNLVVNQVSAIDTTQVATRIEQKSTVIVKSSFAKMLEGDGTFWLEHWMDNGVTRYEYGNVRLPAGTTTPLEAHFVWANGAWQADTMADPPGVILTLTGWQDFADGASGYTVAFNAVDGTALLTHTATGVQEKLSATEADLAGKTHGTMGGELAALLVNPAAPFPVGAKGYKLTFVPQQDIYTVDFWADPQGVDQNVVRVGNPTNGQDTVVTTLAELPNLFAENSGNYLEVGGGDGFSLAVQFTANGMVKCFKRSWDWTIQPQLLMQMGSWSEAQVLGQTLLKLAIPEQYRALVWDNGMPFFVVKDGVVKRGQFQAAGTIDSDEYMNLNKAAFDSLSGNVNFK